MRIKSYTLQKHELSLISIKKQMTYPIINEVNLYAKLRQNANERKNRYAFPFWQLPKAWGITIVQDRCLTDNFSIFGETRFSARDVEPYDFFTLPRMARTFKIFQSIDYTGCKKEIRPHRPPDGNGFPSIQLPRNRFQIFLTFSAHNQSDIRQRVVVDEPI